MGADVVVGLADDFIDAPKRLAATTRAVFRGEMDFVSGQLFRKRSATVSRPSTLGLRARRRLWR
jgi:hypothetical protein